MGDPKETGKLPHSLHHSFLQQFPWDSRQWWGNCQNLTELRLTHFWVNSASILNHYQRAYFANGSKIFSHSMPLHRLFPPLECSSCLPFPHSGLSPEVPTPGRSDHRLGRTPAPYAHSILCLLLCHHPCADHTSLIQRFSSLTFSLLSSQRHSYKLLPARPDGSCGAGTTACPVPASKLGNEPAT